MQDTIKLGSYSFKRKSEKSNQFLLEGEYKEAFFLNLNEEEKKLEVNMNVGCSCCGGPGPSNLEQLTVDLCKGKPCRVEDEVEEMLCPYQEGDGCVEGNAPIEIEWDKMAEEAKKQFPGYQIDQMA